SGSIWIRHHSDTASSALQASGGAGGQVEVSSASARSNCAERMRSYTAASLSAPVSAASAGAADSNRRTASPELHARAAVLLFSMPFERERDELVDERREREAARRPHLR